MRDLQVAAGVSAPWYRSPQFVLALLTCALLLPFSGKSFHIDDPLFLWTAQHIREHPLDFYGFDVNWYGWKQPISEIAQNPPLVSYYAALFGALFGFSERALHLALLVPAVLFVVGTWRLAQLFTRRSVLAAVIALATPAFLVSSVSVMCDTSMACLWVWAVVLWVEGLDEGIRSKLVGAALLVAAASLTKYFGMCLIPLLATYTFVRGARRQAAWLVLPIGILAAYQAWTSRLYGHGLLFQAAQYASEQRGKDVIPRYASLLIGLGFCGGCMLPLVCFAHRVWSKRALAMLAAIGIAAAAVVAASPSAGLSSLPAGAGVRWGIALQLALWCAVGAGVLLLAFQDLRVRRDARSLLLLLWVVGTFAFACFVNWTINARSFLPLSPALAILLARRLEARRSSPIHVEAWRELAPLLPAFVAGLCFVWADIDLAAAGKSAAQAIDSRYPASKVRLYFEGHWGFQYYMQALGREPLDFRTFHLEPGDLLVVPHNTTGWHPLPEKVHERVETIEMPVVSWLATMCPWTAAGFYASNIGLLPFSFGPTPSEAYDVMRIVLPTGARR